MHAHQEKPLNVYGAKILFHFYFLQIKNPKSDKEKLFS